MNGTAGEKNVPVNSEVTGTKATMTTSMNTANGSFTRPGAMLTAVVPNVTEPAVSATARTKKREANPTGISSSEAALPFLMPLAVAAMDDKAGPAAAPAR